MSDLAAVEQKAFNGGMNSFASDDTVGETDVFLLQNMKINARQNAIEQVKGTEFILNPVSQDDTNTKINSVFRFYLADGTKHSLAHYTITSPAGENQVLIFDGSTNKGELDFTPAIGAPITDYAVFLDTVYMVNGSAKVFPWDGDIGTITGLSPSADLPVSFKPTLIEMYKGRAYYAGDATLPSRVIASQPGLPVTFDSPFVEPIIEVNASDGDKITAMKVLGGNLIVFKLNNFYILQGSLPQRVDPHPSIGVGCLDQATIQKTQLGLVFLSRAGVYLYTGTQLILLSRKITNDLRLDTIAATGSFSSAYHDNIYYIFFKPTTENHINIGFSFDLNEIEFGGNEIGISKLFNWRLGGSVIHDGGEDNNEWYAFQDETSNIIRVLSPNADEFYNDSTSDLAISSQITSRWFDMGNRAIEKELRRIFFFTHEAMNEVAGTIEYEFRGRALSKTFKLTTEDASLWDTAEWDVDVWDGGIGLFRYDVILPQGVFGNRFRIKLAPSMSITFLNLDRMRLHFRPLREI